MTLKVFPPAENQDYGAHQVPPEQDDTGGGGGAPTNAQYVTMALDATLTNERRLQATSPIVLTDGGANGDATLTHATSGVVAASYGSTTQIPVVTVNATGHVTAVSTATPTLGIAAFDMFGDGSDGAIDFDGSNTFSFASKSGSTYALTRSIAGTQINVRAGVSVNAANSNVFASTNLDIAATGLLHNNGLSATGVLGGSSTGVLFWQATATGSAGTGTTAPSGGGAISSNGLGGAGGGGGSSPSGAGGTGGAVTIPTASNGGVQHSSTAFAAWMGRCNNSGAYGGGAGGAGGRGDASGSGAGGGSGGGCLGVFAKTITGAGTISCDGGAGGTPAVAATNAGGGGGGGGGCLWVITTSAVTTTSFNGTGTLSAAGGAGSAGKGTGASGSNGSAGRVYPIRIAS